VDYSGNLLPNKQTHKIMADIFFLLAGIVLLFKKEVHISRKRALSGWPVRMLAILYILPFAVGFVGSFVLSAVAVDPLAAVWISLPFTTIAILTTLYLIFFHRPRGATTTNPVY
jgi:hypothetical protein